MLKNMESMEKNMKRLRNSLLILSLTIVGFLAAGTAAKADPLTIDLASPYQSGPGGTVLSFDATVINNTDAVLYLNGDGLTWDDLDISHSLLDDSPFVTGFPLSLDPGKSYTGLLFTAIAPGYVQGANNSYTGAFVIQGGGDDSTFDNLGSANFDVNVTPEPSTFMLFGTGLLALAVFLSRRKLMA